MSLPITETNSAFSEQQTASRRYTITTGRGRAMNLINGETAGVLQLDDRDAIAVLTLNRPAKLNALNNELLGAIMQSLDDIELDPAIRVIVITGAGRAFSAGADIAGFQRHLEAGPAEAVMHF